MRRTAAFGLTIAFTSMLAGGAAAAPITISTPVPGHSAAPSSGAYRVPIGPTTGSGTSHTMYGTIIAIQGEAFTLRLRNGQSMQVDATDAIKRGTVSNPLFVNKIVSVQGYRAANGTFHAQTVTRMTRLENTPSDK
jgi:hypothetical protein